jgi:hypothetical protein
VVIKKLYQSTIDHLRNRPDTAEQMKTKDIAKGYARLAADERFRRFVDAMGRNDDQELHRLDATCPRHNYSAQEYEYTRKKTFFAELALTTAIQRLRVDLLAMLALVVGLASDGEDDERAAISDKALEAFKKLLRLAQGKRDAWRRFCGGLGVDPDAVVSPFLGDIHWTTEMMQAVSEVLGNDSADEFGSTEDIATGELATLVELWGNARTQ